MAIREATRPLIGHRDPDTPLAWRDGRAISARTFLAEVAGMAAALPDGADVINLCADRYRFAVTFMAAVLAGRRNLLPQNRAPATLAQLRREHPQSIAIVDDPADPDESGSCALFDALCGAAECANDVPAVSADHVAALVFTSGSTGVPKANIKRWGAIVDSAHAEREALRLQAPFHLLATVPPQHMYGLESSVLLPIVSGGAFHVARPLFPVDIAALLASLPAPRVLVTAPIHVRACLASDAAFPSLELLLSAAAPLPLPMAQAAEARYATRVEEIYGFTEAGMVASRRTSGGPEWQVLPGVRLHHDGTRWGFTAGHVEGVKIPGDAIEPAVAGDPFRFRLAGREDDLVNVAGKRASLAELSGHLTAIPGVVDGVFFLPQPDGEGVSQRLTAFVVAPGMTAARIRDALRSRVDAAFLPRPLILVDALPRNAAGKLPRDALAAFARQHAPGRSSS